MSRKSKILIIAGSLAGVLLVIAIPNFIRARSTSSAQACINNLRQIDAAGALVDLEINKNRLRPATEAFIRDRKARGISVPTMVTFSELVSGGYLAKSDVAAFSNAEVTVSLRVAQTNSETIWIRVRFADGFEMGQLANGKFIGGKYVSRWWK
jgi:hypothetical protein